MKKRIPITPGSLTDHQIGMNDILTSTNSTGALFGDAGGNLRDHSIGGNDSLSAQLVFNAPVPNPVSFNMFGDAVGGIFDHARGGDEHRPCKAIYPFSSSRSYGEHIR